MRAWLAAALLVLVPLGPASAQSTQPQPLSISAYTIPRFEVGSDTKRFGALQFLSGLELTGDKESFGGISGLWVAPDGERFLAVSDRGSFIGGRFTSEGGKLTGITDAWVTPVRAPSGRPLRQVGSADTESLSVNGKRAVVGVERSQVVLSFTLDNRGVPGPAANMAVPAGLKRVPRNRGPEAIAFVPSGLPSGGGILVISERSKEGDNTPTAAFLIGGKTPGELQVARRDNFDITDAAFLPGGDLLILERWYSGLRGVAFRIRRVASSSIAPGALLDGPVLIEGDMGDQIDNMEALAVHTDAAGRTILTLMSDDNFSFFQRTLVLRFALVDDKPS